MNLVELRLHQFRHFNDLSLQLSTPFNLIVGANGAGKTSILEAIYVLGTGHSFRSRDIGSLILHDKSSLNVFARFDDQQTISVQKSLQEPTLVKLNHQFCRSGSQLAETFPILVLYQDMFSIIDAGPAVRRVLLDWGMFHVKHQYLALWKNYQYLLKQRNALLRQRPAYTQVEIWDDQLAAAGEELNQYRQSYFEQWQKEFTRVLSQFSDIGCTLNYYQGWDKKNSGKSLRDILKEHYAQDLQRQYTQYGAHQADIIIQSDSMKVKQILSRGQQKLILFALRFAQANLLDKPCLVMIDDIGAELDRSNVKKVLNYLQSRPGQYVITSIDDEIFKENIDEGNYITLV